MIAVTPLSPDGYGRSPWKNGGGIFIDIADAYRDDAPVRDWDSLLWRFGRTAITTPGPFSYLPDIARMQMVVKGRGLVLEAPDQQFDERRPFTSVRFPGELEIVTRLEAGPVEVVNLMANRAATEIDLLAITRPGMMSLGKGTHLIYAASGESLVRIDGAGYPLVDDGALRLDLTSPVQLSLVSGLVVIGSIVLK